MLCETVPVQDDKLGRLLSGSLTQNYDAVIGSLPKGLTHDERLRIRESMPMSPALGALQQIPEVSETQYTLTVHPAVSLAGVRPVLRQPGGGVGVGAWAV
jgi:hypothetical protein